MISPPSISVIIPVYNAESRLERCVHSILKQTFQDFELILVDDGFKDERGIICYTFNNIDSRINYSVKFNPWGHLLFR